MDISKFEANIITHHLTCQAVGRKVILFSTGEESLQDIINTAQQLIEWTGIPDDFTVSVGTGIYTVKDLLQSVVVIERVNHTRTAVSKVGSGVLVMLVEAIHTGATIMLHSSTKAVPSNIRNAVSQALKKYAIERIDTDLVRIWDKTGQCSTYAIHLTPIYKAEEAV